MDQQNCRKYAKAITQVIIGILVIVAIILLLQNLLSFVQATSTPEGWQIIRPPHEVSTLIIDNDTVWTGGKEGVILIDRLTGTTLPLPPGAPRFSYVRAIVKDASGTIWIGHDAGLVRYDGTSWTVVAPENGIPFLKVLSIAEISPGKLAFGTDKNICVLQNGTWKDLSGSDGPEIAYADVLFVDRDKNLWAGCSSPTQGRLYRFDGSAWKGYTISDGLPHASVRAITQTKDGAVWVATGFSRHGGAARYYQGIWTNSTVNDGLAGESTRSVYEDTAGRLWIGSEYDGIAVQSAGSWRIITANDGLAGNEVKVMTQDKDKNYWLGTEKGLSRIAAASV